MFTASSFPAQKLGRRQFGMLLGGGAVLLAAGGSYGVAARSNTGEARSLAMPFGEVRILRAGLFSRMDSQGHVKTFHLASALPLLGRQGDSLQRARFSQPASASGSGNHGHGNELQPPVPQPVNLTWGNVVVLDLEIQNDRDRAVPFSPGQLRLKLGGENVTVTPQDSTQRIASLAAHSTESVLISYLAPPAWSEFELEVADCHHAQPWRISLPPLARSEVYS